MEALAVGERHTNQAETPHTVKVKAVSTIIVYQLSPKEKS
jgi:hypothetical protein